MPQENDREIAKRLRTNQTGVAVAFRTDQPRSASRRSSRRACRVLDVRVRRDSDTRVRREDTGRPTTRDHAGESLAG